MKRLKTILARLTGRSAVSSPTSATNPTTPLTTETPAAPPRLTLRSTGL